MIDFTSIRHSIENIRDSVDTLYCPDTEQDCTDIRRELRRIESELDDFEPEEEDEFTELVPENLSAGEADSLKEVIKKWRTDNGYPNN